MPYQITIINGNKPVVMKQDIILHQRPTAKFGPMGLLWEPLTFTLYTLDEKVLSAVSGLMAATDHPIPKLTMIFTSEKEEWVLGRCFFRSYDYVIRDDFAGVGALTVSIQYKSAEIVELR